MQTRVDELMRDIEDKKREAYENEKKYLSDLEILRQESLEEQQKLSAAMKLERGDYSAERERARAALQEREQELERRIREIGEEANREKGLVLA